MLRECTINWSDKELKLVEHYGYSDLADRVEPLMLYRMMVNKAFAINDQSEYANSLRRCSYALDNCTVYRMTPEFDKLITV